MVLAVAPVLQVSGTLLHLIDTGGPGGAETIYLNLVCGLQQDRWRSIAVVPEKDWLWSALESAGVEPLLLQTHGSFDLAYLRGISELVRRHDVDLIQTHLLSTSVYASLGAMRSRVPVVCTFHGPKDVMEASYRAAKFRIMRRRQNRYVFVSYSLQRWFLENVGIGPARTRVIHNGIDTDAFRPRPSDDAVRAELNAQPGDVLIGAVGNFRSPKDYPNFLHAAARLVHGSPHYRFVIVGSQDGPIRHELETLRRQLDLEQQVFFAGFHEDIARVMNALDVYVLSSSSEGFSLTTVQAMACGVPVVATRCGGPEEIVVHNETGLLVPPREPAALAAAIDDLANDESRRRAFGTAARERALDAFSIHKMIREYAALYDECLATRERSSWR